MTLWVGLALIAGGVSLAVRASDDDDAPATRAPAPTSTTTTLERPDPAAGAPAGDQIRIAGPVGSFEISGSLTDPVGLPLTFTAPARSSEDNAEVRGGSVDGDEVTIVWDAGRPLLLSGDGQLSFDPATFVLSDGSTRAEVGGSGADFSPGEFRIDAPIAVGQAGLARPRDAVDFRVASRAAITFGGDVSVALPREPLAFVGPGSVVMNGVFTVERPDGSLGEATTVRLAEGSFEIEVSPLEDGFIVVALLQGEVDVQ